MSHLGDDVSALVDGQLPPARAEEALAHLVTCDGCAELVAVERASRRRLAQAGDVSPSEDLTSRLLDLARTPQPVPGPARVLADHALRPLATRRGRRRILVGGAFALAGVTGAAAALVTVGALVERTGDPATMLSSGGAGTALASTVRLDQSAGSNDAALSWLRGNGWVAPGSVPPGTVVSHLVTRPAPAGGDIVELQITRGADLVNVVEQRGVLEVDGGTGALIHAVPGPMATLVLQCDDVVVVLTGTDDELVQRIAESFPATAPGADVADRLDRGWETVVGLTDLVVQQR